MKRVFLFLFFFYSLNGTIFCSSFAPSLWFSSLSKIVIGQTAWLLRENSPRPKIALSLPVIEQIIENLKKTINEDDYSSLIEKLKELLKEFDNDIYDIRMEVIFQEPAFLEALVSNKKKEASKFSANYFVIK